MSKPITRDGNVNFLIVFDRKNACHAHEIPNLTKCIDLYLIALNVCGKRGDYGSTNQ